MSVIRENTPQPRREDEETHYLLIHCLHLHRFLKNTIRLYARIPYVPVEPVTLPPRLLPNFKGGRWYFWKQNAILFSSKDQTSDCMSTSQQTSLQILDTLDRFARAWSRNDLDGLVSLADPEISGFFPRTKSRILGSDGFLRFIPEVCSGSGGSILRFHEPLIEAIGTVAWVSSCYSLEPVADKGDSRENGRFTAVLKGTGHSWVFSQFHFSLP